VARVAGQCRVRASRRRVIERVHRCGAVAPFWDLDRVCRCVIQGQGTPVAARRARAELETKGVNVKDGFWGYRLLVVRDPDGNELHFNYPDADEAPAEN